MPPAINLKSGNLSGTSNYLSFLGHRQLEMLYFIQLSGEPLFIDYINCISALVEQLPKHNGLYYEKYYRENKWHSFTSSLNMHSREFYFNLIRAYIHSGGRDLYSYVQYGHAITTADHASMFGKSIQSGLIYARAFDINEGVHQKWSSGNSCYLGAMLALGVDALKRNLKSINESLSSKEWPLIQAKNIDRQWKLAIEITETCHQAAIRTRTGLLPQRFIFTQHEEATTALVTIGILTPELAESYFILWRLTHDQKYREYAWQLVMAIYEHCRTDNGYAQVQNVNRVPTIKNNVQLPIFLSATLKYLFLTFTEDSVLPIDQWVYSAAGHPFPIFGNISDNG
ncbi:mannosyl-oligosaccharide alpha-1,2-mannosidase IA-like [Macrosteles quadrilineatus]|uniref:mannosyl-oligosaccharide alpha-1,2-mannosidase IA-like n=1 Tax=Macrosteles quadrilineatus TaxID=74068 RepID=UPI0023E15286|nr:mannosyl-oligosaccharide alpha-1,2-mannosidase IA-like [Macrosteles quadrilineatus]